MKLSVKSDCVRAAVSLGVFICWRLSILQPALLNSKYNLTEALFNRLKIGFYFGEFVSLTVLFTLLIFLNIEKIITNKYIKHFPGILVCVLSAVFFFAPGHSFLTSFLAGCGSALGAAAVLTSFLKIRTRHRLYVAGCSVFSGIFVNILITAALPAALSEKTAYSIPAALIAAVPLFTLYFVKYSVYPPADIKLFDRKTVWFIFKKTPFEYLLFTPVCAAFVSVYISSERYLLSLNTDNNTYNTAALIVSAVTALIIGVAAKPHNVSGIFACGFAFSGAGALFLSVSFVTSVELWLYSIFKAVGFACFLLGAVLFTTAFTLDRLHPLFFSVAGYASLSLGILIGVYISCRIADFSKIAVHASAVLIILAPVIMLIISTALKKHGYSAYAIERRRRIRRRISAVAEEFKLSGRECAVLELLIAEECEPEELKYRLFVTAPALKRHLKSIEKKTKKSYLALKSEFWDNDDENALNEIKTV